MQGLEEQVTIVADERDPTNEQDVSNGEASDSAVPDALADGTDAQDAAAGLPALQAEFRRLAGPLGAIAKIRPADPKSLERLDAALQRLPSGASLAEALEGLRERATRYLHAARRERIAAFRPLEADWVRTAREAGKALRERSNGWRVDMLELQLQREQARARFFYNREALTPWSPVGSAADLAALEERARTLLQGVALPAETLADLFWEAYEQERAARQRAGRGRAEAVPLPDFYRGVRVALVRHELAGQGPEKRLRWAEVPRWAFLYNLDRYRALGATAPEARRLGLQTGSQQESRQFGMVVNGLDAAQDYRTMCFVVPFGGGQGGS